MAELKSVSVKGSKSSKARAEKRAKRPKPPVAAKPSAHDLAGAKKRALKRAKKAPAVKGS